MPVTQRFQVAPIVRSTLSQRYDVMNIYSWFSAPRTGGIMSQEFITNRPPLCIVATLSRTGSITIVLPLALGLMLSTQSMADRCIGTTGSRAGRGYTLAHNTLVLVLQRLHIGPPRCRRYHRRHYLGPEPKAQDQHRDINQ